MSRRLTSYLTLLLVTLFSMPALAQLDELNLKSVTVSGEAAESLTPDTQWYVVYNKRQNGKKAGGYWTDMKGESITYMTNGIEEDVVKPGDLATEKADILVRFLSTETEGQYTIQFGTGNYMNKDLWSTAKASEAQAFNVYLINGEAGHFGINKADMADIVDNNGGGYSLAYWSSGAVTTSGGNNDWSIYPVMLTELTERDLMDMEINKRLALYEQYLEGREGTLDRGQEIGQYDVTDDEFNAWTAHVQKVYDVLDGKYPDITNEEIQSELDAIDAGWAYIESKYIKLVIANGNYRIVSAITWTNTTSTVVGTDPATGEDITEETETHPTKAMYGTQDTKQVKWDNLDETDCRYLWKITNLGTDSLQVMNIATDGIINTIPTSAVATLDPESTTTMNFMFIKRNEDGKVVLSFQPWGGNTTSFAHCGGHGGGKGKSGNIVGWSNGSNADASQWILEPVDDETVAKLIEDYAPYKNHELMVANFQALQARADSAIAAAKADTYVYEHGEGLLTSGEQFSSPYTCGDEEPNGKSFDNLFDGNSATYWHSSWSSTVPAHTHYFQVALTEAVAEGTMLQVYMARRTSAANDHITAMTVYGANDASALDDATEDSWTRLDSISTPWSSGQTEVNSNVFQASGYQYLRFYIDDTAGSQISSTRGYGHMAQFQLYPTTVVGQTQYSQMGEVRTNLEAALEKAAAIEAEELTMDDYKELETIVDAFLAALVDPSALDAAIQANKDAAQYVVTGNNPGQWAEGSDGSALANLIAEAQAYLKSGAYTHEKTDELTTQITETAQGLMASANKVEEGKWYSIRFDSEDNYDNFGWSKGNVVNETLGDLYGTRLVPANQVDDETGSSLEVFSSLSEVGIGQALRFANPDDIASEDQTAFRFIARGDSAFLIQHKSGLYVNALARGNALSLGLTPGIFDVKACGLGKVLIHARRLNGTELYDTPVYLHAQNAGHSLVTWSADEVSSNSALFIEPVDGFDEGDEVAESIKKEVLPNSMRIWCYGAGFKVQDGQLYEYKGASIGDNEISLAFNEVSEAKPGQPVLYINGELNAFNKDAEKEQESIMLTGTDFVTEPDSVGGIHGTFSYQWVDPDYNVVVAGGTYAQEGNHFEEATGEDNTDCTRDVSANTGYIIPAENVIADFNAADYSLVITLQKGANAIEKVEELLTKRADIYTIDGKLVKKNGTMSDIKAMGRGLYIIGGAKVTVK